MSHSRFPETVRTREEGLVIRRVSPARGKVCNAVAMAPLVVGLQPKWPRSAAAINDADRGRAHFGRYEQILVRKTRAKKMAPVLPPDCHRTPQHQARALRGSFGGSTVGPPAVLARGYEPPHKCGHCHCGAAGSRSRGTSAGVGLHRL